MIIAVLVVACNNGGSGAQAPSTVAEVMVTAPTTRIEVGETVQLTATAEDASGAELEGVTFEWTSGITTVATVSENGLVTGVGKGGSRIRATTGEVTGSLIIQVDLGPLSE